MLILTVCLFQPVRKAQESQKEMKLLLDMYKSAPKEQRDKVQLMAAERKSKAEVCSSAIHLPSFPHSESERLWWKGQPERHQGYLSG